MSPTSVASSKINQSLLPKPPLSTLLRNNRHLTSRKTHTSMIWETHTSTARRSPATIIITIITTRASREVGLSTSFSPERSSSAPQWASLFTPTTTNPRLTRAWTCPDASQCALEDQPCGRGRYEGLMETRLST